ncbi:MAG: 4Fe-4S binding protein [Desulfobacterales bacterium]|nr:4Fe-4S binding protein [Desulfobacterales bacterium]
MKELVIISGKGGTGKTSLTAAFASLCNNIVLCDADVDAADLHLLVNPNILSRTDFMGGGQAVIHSEKCTHCGLCKELCRFHAIKENSASDSFEVDSIACEGCGVCVDFCPEKAIDFQIKTCGQWYISETRFGTMVHAQLGIAEENSGKLVTLVRKEARKIAEAKQADLIITDGPPGVGCPVIASIGGATAILIVAEPTVSGLHDMERAIQLALHFRVPGMVCVNKYDLNPDKTNEIVDIATKNGMQMIGKIPFDPIFTQAMICAKTIIEYTTQETSTLSKIIKDIWDNILSTIEIIRKKSSY